jgi:ABC-2 type transport system ATP-binding protein
LAVDSLSVNVQQGSVFGFLGPNGAGKTTTIRMVMDIYAPDGGSIRVFGDPPGERTRRRIGYLPEDRGLYQDMKVLDQLRFFRDLYGLPEETGEKRIDYWLNRFDLNSYRDKLVTALSKGTQQKIQFIVAVLHDPELLILDEPFSGLDPISVDVVKGAILEQRKSGKTIIFSTHQMEQVEQLCDEICLLDRGRRLLLGTLTDVKRLYSRNVLRIAFQNENGFLERLAPGRVQKYPEFYEIALKHEAESQEILSRSMVFGAYVTRFEIVKASLNDIFLETVKAAAHA